MKPGAGGISVEVIDAENGYFQLSLGGRVVTCREFFSDLTTAVAMSRCDDKAVTKKILSRANLRVPAQITAHSPKAVERFIKEHGRVVVKPARGEQGAGVIVDLERFDEITAAIEKAGQLCDKVVLEEYVEDDDLRIIVIDNQVVAAAARKPATVKGTGDMTIRSLME